METNNKKFRRARAPAQTALASMLVLANLGGAAMAQAQTSSVSLGGIMDGGLRYDSGSTSGSQASVGSGQMAASRLTFAGEEALAGGLKASFVLESGLSLDTGAGFANAPGAGTGLTFGRTSTVGVGSDTAGYLTLGRQYTPMWSITGTPSNDPFSATWLGGTGAVFNTTIRASNSVVYSKGYGSRALLRPAPAKGWGYALMYGVPEVNVAQGQPSQSGQQLGFNLSYGQGAWWVGYGYHQVRGSNESISLTAPVADSPKLRQQVLGASVQLGPARVHASVNSAKNGTSVDSLAWYLGASYPLNAQHVLRASYGKSNDRTAANADFATWQIGYQYLFSRRTSLYAAWGLMDNSEQSRKTFSGAVGSYANGASARSVIVGLRHNF